MRPIPFDIDRVMRAVVIILSFLVLAQPAVAQDPDTVSVDSTAQRGTFKIQIEGGGIRVESEDGSTSSDRDRLDTRIRVGASDRRVFRELGTDIVRFGEDVIVDASDLVRGDIVVFGGNVSVAGKVLGNVVVMAGNAEIRAEADINGDVVVLGGELDAPPEARILGERVMVKEIQLSGLSQIFGSHARLFAFFFVPVQFFISLILSWLVVLFMRERVVKSQDHVQGSALKCFGAGFLVLCAGVFVVLILAIVLLITLIGIPLALILIVSCVAVFIIARTVFVYALGVTVGRKINIQTHNPFGAVLIGTAVLYLPALVGYGVSVWPFGTPLGVLFKGIGFLFSTFAYLVGLGALFLSRFGVRPVPPTADDAAAPGAPPVPSTPAGA